MAIPIIQRDLLETIYPLRKCQLLKLLRVCRRLFFGGFRFQYLHSRLETRNPLRKRQPLELCGFAGGFSWGDFIFIVDEKRDVVKWDLCTLFAQFHTQFILIAR